MYLINIYIYRNNQTKWIKRETLLEKYKKYIDIYLRSIYTRVFVVDT